MVNEMNDEQRKLLAKLMNNTDLTHKMIQEIKKYAVKADNAKTVKTYKNNMKKFHSSCKNFIKYMNDDYHADYDIKYDLMLHHNKFITGEYYVPHRIGFPVFSVYNNNCHVFAYHLDFTINI